MNKLTRDYYAIYKAAELLGCGVEELLHKGAVGSLPMYIIPRNWRGIIFDISNFVMEGEHRVYGRTPERTVLRGLVEGRLFAGTVQFFEDGEEEITVNNIWYPPNPETGNLRQVDLDVPVAIKKTQLYVFTKDIENIVVETTSRSVEGSNKRVSRPKSAPAIEPSPPDLEIEPPKIAKPVEPVSTTPTAVDTENRYLTIKEVMVLTGLGRQTIYDAMKAGNFPEPVRPTGSRAVRWNKSAVDDHMKSGSKNPRKTETGGKAVGKIKGGK